MRDLALRPGSASSPGAGRQHQDHYLRQAVNTASPAQLVTMLYDRLLVALRRSQAGLANGNQQVVHDELIRAQRIVDELKFSLDDDAGGDIAANLRSIYDYGHEQLVLVNSRKDGSQLPVLIDMFTSLRTAWHEGVEALQSSTGQSLTPQATPPPTA